MINKFNKNNKTKNNNNNQQIKKKRGGGGEGIICYFLNVINKLEVLLQWFCLWVFSVINLEKYGITVCQSA